MAAAVSEEILFRGFIQTSLERGSLGRGGAIFLTSFLFAAIHLIPQGMPSYVLAGVVLGITAVATESILIPIVIHAVNNTAAILLLNVADMDSLGQPDWIPPQILDPGVPHFRDHPRLLCEANVGVRIAGGSIVCFFWIGLRTESRAHARGFSRTFRRSRSRRSRY